MLSTEDKKALEAATRVLSSMADSYINGMAEPCHGQTLEDELDSYPGLFECVNGIFENIAELKGHIREVIETGEMPQVWKEG